MAETIGSGRVHFPALDGVRGIAILLVFFFHYGGGNVSGGPFVQTIARFNQGWIGVTLFFVLSGFLITGGLLDTRGRSGYYTVFFIKRVSRIFPLYYLVLVLLVAAGPLLHAAWSLGHLSFVFYVQNFATFFDPRLDRPSPYLTLSHFWSLAVEEQFYMVWPALVLWADDRKLQNACLWLCAASVAFRIAVVATGIDGEAAGHLTPGCLDALALGGWLAAKYRAGEARDAKPMLAFGALSVGIVAKVRHGFSIHDPVVATIGLAMLAWTCTGLIAVSLEDGAWLASRWTSGLRFFGKYSYGIYVFHFLFQPALVRLIPFLSGSLHSFVLSAIIYAGTAMAATLAIAIPSYHLIERPLLEAARRRLAEKNTMATGSF